MCAQSGTFTKAAEKLRISQPSLSMQIKSFEDQLGFHLFVRTGRSIQLTPKGESLFVYASKIFEVTDDIDKFLKKNEPVENRLKIGVSDEIERPFIAEISGRLIKTNSAKHLMPTIISKKHDAIVQLAAEEEVDVIITNEKVAGLKLVNYFSFPVMLISGEEMPFPPGNKLKLQNIFKLIDQRLILPTDEMILAKETKSFLKANHLTVSTALTSNIIACITRSVYEKLGAAFLPVPYVSREIRNGNLRAYGPQEGYWQHSLYLYTQKGNSNIFISSLSKILQDFSALKFDSHFHEASI